MVLATWVPKNRKAMKLKAAAHTTASRGDSTRVDTTVAMELAASWNPLTKSKPERDQDHEDQREVFHGSGQACLRTIDSTTSEMSSIVFMAPSRASTMPFHAQHLDGLQLAAVEAAEDPAVHRVALALLGVDRVEVGLARPSSTRAG